MADNAHLPAYDELVAYVLGELDSARASRVTAHLADCIDCRATARRLHQLRNLLRRRDVYAPPPAALARAQAIYRAPQPARPAARTARLAPLSLRYALTLIILVVTCGFSSTYAMADLSREALPGDALYPVKTAIEDLQMAVITDEADKTRLQIYRARTRAHELLALAAEGRYDDLSAATVAFEAQVAETNAWLGLVMETDPILGTTLAERLERELSSTSRQLAQIQFSAPLARPAIAQAVAASETGKTIALAQIPIPTYLPLMPPDTPTQPAPATAAPTSTPIHFSAPLPAATAVPSSTPWPTPTSTPTNTGTPTPLPSCPPRPRRRRRRRRPPRRRLRPKPHRRRRR